MPSRAVRQWRQVALELAAITLLGLLYFSQFPVKNIPSSGGLELHLMDADVRLDGLEHERLSGVLLPIAIGLRDYGHIPTWNPYMGTGEPTLNNPFNYLFNPFASLPVLILGGVQGTKLALLISLWLAGCNMWLLMRVLGVGSAGRVTSAALYLMSGGIAGKFHVGHFQLGLSLAWIPLVFAGLWWTLHSRDRRAPVLLAFAFALLFFVGNIYYTLHTLVCSVVIVVFHLFDRHPNGGNLHLQIERVRRLAIGAIFAFGLAALQFIPVWAAQHYIGGHPGDPELASRYDLGQALVNFVFPWPNWSIFEDPNYRLLVGVDYAYIGASAFTLIAGAAALLLTRPSLRQRFKGPAAAIALILAVIMTVWGAGQTPILQYLYANIPRLAEFRYVGRAHSVAALWWLALAGLSVDVVWRQAVEIAQVNPIFAGYDRRRLIRALFAGGLIWVLFLVYSAQTEAGRVAAVLYNYRLKETLDSWRFATFGDAAQGLFALLIAALLADTIALIMRGLLRPADLRPYGTRLRIWQARGLRLAVLWVIFLAVMDVMLVNSRLLVLNRRIADFSALYPLVRDADSSTPFPAVNEPLSPYAFSAYEYEIRNWGLDEGWTPTALPDIIPFEAGPLRTVPRWAIVWGELGGRETARIYVNDYGYEARQCASTAIKDFLSERCNLNDTDTALLYELPDALPYTFVASAHRLTTEPQTVTTRTIFPAEVVSHRQDTITIEASRPASPIAYYLVVQETHFPGWKAWVDNAPVQTVTIGGFIGIAMPPGMRTYSLRFEPPGLAVGIVIFLATIVAIGFYLRGGQHASSPAP